MSRFSAISKQQDFINLDRAVIGKHVVLISSLLGRLGVSYSATNPPQALKDAVKFWIDNCVDSIDLQDYLNMAFNAQDFVD